MASSRYKHVTGKVRPGTRTVGGSFGPAVDEPRGVFAPPPPPIPPIPLRMVEGSKPPPTGVNPPFPPPYTDTGLEIFFTP